MYAEGESTQGPPSHYPSRRRGVRHTASRWDTGIAELKGLLHWAPGGSLEALYESGTEKLG
jgi:hypothetical protein